MCPKQVELPALARTLAELPSGCRASRRLEVFVRDPEIGPDDAPQFFAVLDGTPP